VNSNAKANNGAQNVRARRAVVIAISTITSGGEHAAHCKRVQHACQWVHRRASRAASAACEKRRRFRGVCRQILLSGGKFAVQDVLQLEGAQCVPLDGRSKRCGEYCMDTARLAGFRPSAWSRISRTESGASCLPSAAASAAAWKRLSSMYAPPRFRAIPVRRDQRAAVARRTVRPRAATRREPVPRWVHFGYVLCLNRETYCFNWWS